MTRVPIQAEGVREGSLYRYGTLALAWKLKPGLKDALMQKAPKELGRGEVHTYTVPVNLELAELAERPDLTYAVRDELRRDPEAFHFQVMRVGYRATHANGETVKMAFKITIGHKKDLPADVLARPETSDDADHSEGMELTLEALQTAAKTALPYILGALLGRG
jgi:hypothetical protein